MVKFWQVSNIDLTSSYSRCSINKAVLKNLTILIGKHLCWNLLLINLQANKVNKPATLLQRDSNIAKFLKASFLKDICERLVLNFIDSKWKKSRKIETHPERNQNPVKYLRWRFLQKKLTVLNCWLFLQNTSYYLFHRVTNMP